MGRRSIVIIASILFSAHAWGQSSPGFVTGQVPTAAQWNAAFASKFDYSGSTAIVVGSGSSIDNAITRFNGTSGKIIQNSAATITDSGILNIPAVSILATAVSGPIVDRGPLFIVNNAASSGNPAGKNMGCQFWVGDNPTATPGANTAVNCTMYIDNLNRAILGGLNIVTFFGDLGAGWADTTGIGMEVEINNFFAANSGTDPFGSSPIRKNGITVTTGFSTVGRTTSAYSNWGAQRDGTGWVDSSFAASSAYNYGWRCIANPGGVADTTAAFKTACLSDESNSAVALKVTGSHTTGVDLSGATISGNAFISPNFLVTGTGIVLASFFQTFALTVGTLPTCNSGARGVHTYVTDATAALTAGIGTIVAAVGANVVPVFCDGTNWRIG